MRRTEPASMQHSLRLEGPSKTASWLLCAVLILYGAALWLGQADPSHGPAPAGLPTGAPQGTSATLSTGDVQARLAGLKLINYYPAHDAQTNLWMRWDPAAIDADFARVVSLHANAVRLILFTPTFGYPDPSATMLDRLAAVIALADAHG